MGATCACLTNYVEKSDSTITVDRPIQHRPDFSRFDSDELLWVEHSLSLEVTSLARGFLERRRLHALSTQASWSLDDFTALFETSRWVAAVQKLPELPPGLVGERRPATRLGNGIAYEGEWNAQNERHGYGREVHVDGTRYEGFYCNGKKEGLGRILFPNGELFHGEFKNNQLNGDGVLFKPDGYSYQGSFRNNKRHGRGREVEASGNEYIGTFSHDFRHGQGVQSFRNGDRYEGDFCEGVMSGKGNYIWKNGNCYYGEFRNNKAHGVGLYLWSDGRKYEGEYQNDVKHGYGIFTWPDKRMRYEGYWKHGLQDGEGELVTETHGSFKRKAGVWKEGTRVS